MLYICGLFDAFLSFKSALVVHDIIHTVIPAVYMLTACLFKSTTLVCSSVLCVVVFMGVMDQNMLIIFAA